MKKLLVHACCGPCFTYINYDLKENGLLLEDGTREKVDFTALFYNPNIHPKVEYERRKEAFVNLCEMENTKYDIIDEYSLNGYVEDVVNKVLNLSVKVVKSKNIINFLKEYIKYIDVIWLAYVPP